MLFSQASILLALSTAVAAVPHEKRWFGGWGQDSSSNFFGKLHSWSGRQVTHGTCDLASIEMPQAPKPLPPVSPGLTLYHVAVGRGTQNYTCDLSNATAVPLAVGAVATLFNMTCLAANSPILLTAMPDIALELPKPTPTDASSPINTDISGHHYFIDDTTPFFNLHTEDHNYGLGAFKKINASDAPATAAKGQNGVGYGAAAWLKLQAHQNDTCVFKEVYRVNTAGGNAPSTCKDQAAAFQIQYSAEYWFYA